MTKLQKLLAVLTTFMLVTFGAMTVANAKDHKVDIKSFKFSVKELLVEVGDTITWTNKDGSPHTATAKDKSWTTKRLKKGESETIKVTANMELNYFCAVHPNMKAKLKM